MWNYSGEMCLSPQGAQIAELAAAEPGDARHHWALSPGGAFAEELFPI